MSKRWYVNFATMRVASFEHFPKDKWWYNPNLLTSQMGHINILLRKIVKKNKMRR
jgi:hypothetical protein